MFELVQKTVVSDIDFMDFSRAIEFVERLPTTGERLGSGNVLNPSNDMENDSIHPMIEDVRLDGEDRNNADAPKDGITQENVIVAPSAIAVPPIAESMASSTSAPVKEISVTSFAKVAGDEILVSEGVVD